MKYLILYQEFKGLFWDTEFEIFNDIEKVEEFLYRNPSFKKVRIFEITKEVKTKIVLEKIKE